MGNCNKGNRGCGCGKKGVDYTIAQPCNPTPCEDGERCAQIISAECVIWDFTEHYSEITVYDTSTGTLHQYLKGISVADWMYYMSNDKKFEITYTEQ